MPDGIFANIILSKQTTFGTHCSIVTLSQAKEEVENMERETIAAIMIKEGLYPEDIPMEANVNPTVLAQIKGSCRYFRCKSSASFDEHIQTDSDRSDSDDEHQCDHSWVSVHAWCVLDLKKQRIAHCWAQECRECNMKCTPFFDKGSVF